MVSAGTRLKLGNLGLQFSLQLVASCNLSGVPQPSEKGRDGTKLFLCSPSILTCLHLDFFLKQNQVDKMMLWENL